VLKVTLTLPQIDTGGFRFVSEPRTLAHGRDRRDGSRPSLLAWMMQHRKELAPGKPFDLTQHAFLRALYEETAQDLVICKSGQAGVSEFLISDALYSCDILDATVLYVFPTDTHVSDFSAARLGTAIESSDYLNGIVVEGRGAGGDTKIRKRGADRVTLKRVRDRFLYFRGGQVKPTGQAPQLKSIDADVLIMDEWDEIDPRAPAIARKRLGHSQLARQRAVSTPTYIGRGIHAEYLTTDQREWHVRCDGCGHWQALTMQSVVQEWDDLERPTVWHGQAAGRAYCACAKCRREVDRLGKGEWVATATASSSARVGYHISKIYSALHEPLALLAPLRSTNETVRREGFNQDWGLPYRPRGGGLDDATLDGCVRDYAPVVSENGFMGIDVGSVLNVVVRARPDAERGERRLLYAGECTWKQLAALWQRYKPSVTVMDAMPETEKAREFQALAPRRIWLAYYPGELKDENPIRKVEDERYILMDRTRTLDETLARFYDGQNTLPANARDIPHYYSQLKAPVRVTEKSARGDEVVRYVESGPDHYCFAAGTLIQTDCGQVPIERVEIGSFVLTRMGYRKVLAAGMTNPEATVKQYHFSDGTRLIATPNHPVYMRGKGFVPLDAVNYGDIIDVCQTNQNPEWKPLFTRVLSSVATQTVRAAQIAFTIRQAAAIANKASSDCIKRFGRTFTALFRRTITSTTETKIPSITSRITWSVFPKVSTDRIMSRRSLLRLTRKLLPITWIAFVLSKRRGIKPKKESSFTRSWPSIFGPLFERPSFAYSAANPLSHSVPNGTLRTATAPTRAMPRIVGQLKRITRRANVQSVVPLLKSTATTRQKPVPDPAPTSSVYLVRSEPRGKLPVYNLTVEEAHEYFANGILVHNCHAENYCMAASMLPRVNAPLIQASVRGW
jgi:hypothetical protein